MPSKLHVASYKGDVVKVRRLLKHGLDVDCREAVQPISLQVGQIRFAFPPEAVNLESWKKKHRNHDRLTALHCAAAGGNLEVIRVLVEAGADVDVRCVKTGFTPLHFATIGNHLQAAKYLIEAGCEMGFTGFYEENTPLHLACDAKDTRIAELLLDAGADVAAINLQDYTPLHLAIDVGNLAMVDLLLRYSPPLDDPDQTLSPVAMAITDFLWDVYKKLVDAGSDINITFGGRENLTALMHASMQVGRTEFVKALLGAGADITAKDRLGRTALHYAAKAGHVCAARLLINAGSDVNEEYWSDLTPLAVAALENQPEMGCYLVSVGAKVDARCRKIVEYEKNKCSDPVCKECSQKYRCAAGSTPLMFAAHHEECLPLVEALLKAGADVNARDEEGMSALTIALKYGYIGVTRALVEAGADVNGEAEHAIHPVRQALYHQSGDLLRILIEAGVDAKLIVDKTKMHASSPLNMWALMNGKDASVVPMLAAAGVEVDIQDYTGMTALHYAATSGATEVAQALLEAGASPSIADDNGKLPFAHAACGKHKDLAMILLEAHHKKCAQEKERQQQDGGGSNQVYTCANPECSATSAKGGKGRLKLCSGCRAVRYCSVECSRAHWKDHKVACKAAA